MTLAQQLSKGLTEQQVLDQAFDLLRQQQGLKCAYYYFNVDSDYASDLVSEYFYLNPKETHNDNV